MGGVRVKQPDYISPDGSIRLYLGDALTLDVDVDAAIVADPPYGMKWDTDCTRFCGGSELSRAKRGKGVVRNRIAGDDQPFDPTPWLEFPEVILWGCNHFGARLPVGTTLVWLKRNDAAFGTFLSDAELAWKKGGHGVYCNRDFSMMSNTRQRSHPNQKPVSIMEWCLSFVKADTILDPYMGSGTTALACIKQQRQFIGIEIDPTHFATAVRRIESAFADQALFAGAST